MRTVGIIAEYNPFHTGHQYHITKAKEAANADYAVIVMSPDFVQRGEPAIFDKYIRTEMALSAGADLVVELPVCYAAGSAEYFAQGAVSVLKNLGIIDAISFGSESGDTELFQKAADIINQEPLQYREILKSALSDGCTYPSARAKALESFGITNDFLKKPNTILGIEYTRAISSQQCNFSVLPILRAGAGYHDLELTGDFISASALRHQLLQKDTFPDFLGTYIPREIKELYQSCISHSLELDNFSNLLNRELLFRHSFSDIADISEDLSDRICSLRYDMIAGALTDACEKLQTKQWTMSRIKRALLHLILDIRQADLMQYRENGITYYTRILGFRSASSELIRKIKNNSPLPVIDVPSRAAYLISSEEGRSMYEKDRFASELYQYVKSKKNGTCFQPEYKRRPVIINS